MSNDIVTTPYANLGRPRLFKTPEDMIVMAQEYFDNTPKEEITITGVALALGTTRETLMDYQKRDDFSDTVKRIKLVVENQYEISLRKHGRSGDIFGLKNFGWVDKSEVDNKHEVVQPILGGSSKQVEADTTVGS